MKHNKQHPPAQPASPAATATAASSAQRSAPTSAPPRPLARTTTTATLLLSVKARFLPRCQAVAVLTKLAPTTPASSSSTPPPSHGSIVIGTAHTTINYTPIAGCRRCCVVVC
jgi:hypothetical protein